MPILRSPRRETLIEELAGIGCPVSEIAAVCGVSAATIEATFSAALLHGHERAKATLRAWQWRAARAGSVPMLIWLGRQVLGQRDRHEHELAGRDGEPPLITLEQVRAVLRATEGEA
jgi:hypothetical protein